MDRTIQPSKRIIHVSGDFPDPVEPFKTAVIRRLIDITSEEFDHVVFSLNRRSPTIQTFLPALLRNPLYPHLNVESLLFSNGHAVTYHAPPRGIYHATMLNQLGKWLAQKIANGPRPLLLVGHKLGIEGIAVARAAQALALPYAISIQGDSDTKVLEARPDLSGRLARVFHEAAVVFPFSPWALDAIERRLGKRKGKVVLLPCPTDLDIPQSPRIGGEGLITAFHLKNYRRKNLRTMVNALNLLADQGVAPMLQVLGGGSEADLVACQVLAKSCDNVKFAGPMDRNEVRQSFANARGFVMPSLRESFGLVFIEALFAGLPIAYPAGTAVDGYLDGLPFALRVDARDPRSVAHAMRRLDSEEGQLKTALGRWLQSDDAKRFTRATIGSNFASGLRGAITE